MTIQLGLIGENISKSRAPRLHPLLGRLCGLDVTYTPFDSEGVPGFDPMATLQARMDEGFKGLNVTHPYKTVVAAALPNLRPRVRRLGSINTVVFVDGQWIGANTDHSGTIRGYRHVFGTLPAGRVLMMGAGGVCSHWGSNRVSATPPKAANLRSGAHASANVIAEPIDIPEA